MPLWNYTAVFALNLGTVSFSVCILNNIRTPRLLSYLFWFFFFVTLIAFSINELSVN